MSLWCDGFYITPQWWCDVNDVTTPHHHTKDDVVCNGFCITPQGYYVIKLITRLLYQGILRLLRHGEIDQSQTVSKSADFRCEKMHFCSSESSESRIFEISALKTIVLKNKTELSFDLQQVNSPVPSVKFDDAVIDPGYMSRKILKLRTDT